MGVSVALLVGVMAAIVFFWQLSRRPAGRPPAVASAAMVEPPPAAPDEPASAAAAVVPADQDEAAEPEDGAGTMSARQQSQFERVIENGSARIKACYQRALVRDDSLVNGHMTVHVSVAASGHVEHVHVTGPAAFHALDPCLVSVVSRWKFPTAPAPYATEFMVAFRGDR